MKETKELLISVIIATPDNFSTIRTTIGYLSRQTLRESIEIIIVAPSSKNFDVDEKLLDVFMEYKIVEGNFLSIGQANAIGVHYAQATIIVFAEDHSFPDPDWAEQLVKAHRNSYAAVSPVVYNANPRSAISWADLFIGYGPWLAPNISGERDFLPGHNTSYKKDILLNYGEQLESMLEAETLLHWDLRSQGYKLYLESSAKTAHTNFSLWSSWLPTSFYCGRLFAGYRIRSMSMSKRFLYIGGSPLIPLVRLIKIGKIVCSSKLRKKFIFCLPTILIGLVADGLGQMVGYCFGPGNSFRKIGLMEFNRKLHISENDRKDLYGN